MQGWDKTYCLRFVKEEFSTIHFFGDKTFPVRALGHRAATCDCWMLVTAGC